VVPRRTKQLGFYDTTDEVITYRFTRLPFGLTCSPFLLSATIGTLATIYHYTYATACALMDSSTYMYVFATSTTNDNDITTTVFEVTSLMNTVHMPMYKWATNSTHLQDIWRKQGLPLQTETQVLGMNWETQSDTIHIDHTDITRALSERSATKLGLIFASGTRGKTHFPGHVDTGTRVGRVTTLGHSRKVVIMDVSVTYLV